jgi:hypothetical protein
MADDTPSCGVLNFQEVAAMPAQVEVAPATSAPRQHEIRRSGGRTFYVRGDAGSGANDHDGYRYTEPHTALIEVSGKSAGTKFNMPTSRVAEWELVTP